MHFCTYTISIGISFTLPKRQIAAETNYLYKLDGLDGEIKVTANVWFDKKRDESQKLTVSFGNEYKVPEDNSEFIMRTSALFNIPTLPKVYSIVSTILQFDHTSINQLNIQYFLLISDNLSNQ